MRHLKTTETATVHNYPYGSLKATVTFSTEFRPGKGFREVFQSINPKNGRLNAPKKTTYYDVIILTQDETGFVKGRYFSFNDGAEGINRATAFLSENFDLFTPEQIKYMYGSILMHIKATFQATCQYCGATPEAVKPVLDAPMKAAIQGWKDGTNVFGLITIDVAALDACKVPDYNPFVVRSQPISLMSLVK